MKNRSQCQVRVPVLRAATLIGALLVLSACASPRPSTTTGAIDTGTFPNLNVPPQTAAAQITPDEKAALLGELGAARNAQAAAASGATSTANPALLKKLAARHGQDALEEIEKDAQ